VVRYAARQVATGSPPIVTAGAVPPIMVKSEANPEGTPIEAFGDIRAAVLADRSQFYQDLSAAFFGTNREGSTISQRTRDEFWRQGMLVGLKGAHGCVKAFSGTDFPTTSSHSRFRCSSLTMTTTRSSRLPPPLRNPRSWSSTPPLRFIQKLRTVRRSVPGGVQHRPARVHQQLRRPPAAIADHRRAARRPASAVGGLPATCASAGPSLRHNRHPRS